MNVVLDVGIGLILLYLVLAIVVTTTQELLATWLRFRAADLYASIRDMIGSQDLADAVYKHPLIKNLCQRRESATLLKPSYIPSKTFALALLDVLEHRSTVSEATGVDDALREARATVERIQIPEVQRALSVLVEDLRFAATSVDDYGRLLSTAIENWFNDRMARTSGWYKRKAQTIALVLAAALTIVTNADSIEVANTLWRDTAVREALVERARSFYESKPTPAPNEETDGTSSENPLQTLKSADLPIGWTKLPVGLLPWLHKLFGLVITTLAVSLGAAFWFDLLGRALQMRGTGPRVSAATGRTEPGEA